MPTEKELMLKQADAETTYQKKLTAGTNITIDPVTNVISSAGGGSTVQYTDNVPNGESVGILAINGQSHPIRIPKLAEGTGITITKDISTNVYTISSTGGGSGTTKSYMGETDPDELVGEDGDLYFKYHKIITVIPTELTLPSLPDDTVVPFPITNFNSYDSFTFYCTDPSLQTTTINLNIGDIPIGDNPAELTPESEIHRFNTFYYAQVSRSTDGEGLVFRVGRNVLFKLEANVTEVDLGIDKTYAKVEDTWLPSGEQVEANPEETSETPLTKIKIDGVTYYIAAGGTAVIPNPEGTPTDELHSIQIDEDIYEIVGGGGSGGNASLDATTLYDTPITSTGTYTLADDYNNYDFIGFKAGNGSTETDIRLYAVKDIQDSMNDNLVITNNVTNSWFNFTINADELTIPGKTVSTIYSVIGYKIKGGGGSSTNVQRLSPEAYNALPQSEKENGTIYFVHQDAGETTISGSFTTGSTQYEKVIVDCGFKPTSISVILPFSNGDTYAEYDEAISTTTSTWEIPMESRTYTITLGSETGESGITDILDNGFKFRCNASNTRNVNCTFEATGVLDNEINKIYYMGNEYTNGGSGDGSQELISYDTTITTTQYGWWTAEDKDGNVLDPDQYELIAVTPLVNNSSSWVGAWDGAFYINNIDGVTDRYDVTFVNINDGGYIRTSRTWNIKVVYRDKNAAGGGGGSTVVPNPQEEPTDTLNTVEIDGVVYDIEGGSEGEGVEIYSEDEYIIGSININGVKKKIYQKTFVLNNITVTQSSGYSYDTTSLGIEDVVESPRGFVKITNSDRRSIPFNLLSGYGFTATVKPNQILLERAGNDITISQAVVTIRYTKTVETDAPAWGGSVTNNYANFIDTSNVIDSGSYQGSFTYTATEECFVNVAVVMSANNSATITIDGEVVTSGWCASLNTINPILPLKKGQTLVATASASNTSNYTVYGITYASGGSESGSSKVEYSTNEHIVGTWIDGRDVYEKTIYYSSLQGRGSFLIDNTLTSSDVDFFATQDVSYIVNNNYISGIGINLEVCANTQGVFLDNNNAPSGYPTNFTDIYVTIRYVKKVAN